MRPLRPALTVALTSALLLAGCTGTRDDRTARPDATAPDPAATAAWEPCPEVPEEVLADATGELPPGAVEQLTTGVTYECATIAVPRDWSEPGDDTFDIALLRARSDDQQDRIGSVVINPGGPGASGVDQAVYLSLAPMFGGLPTELTSRFDIVGFDPRGVKRSSPVECFSDAQLDDSFGAEPDPVQREEFEQILADSRQMADACGAEHGDALDHYSTHQTARDLDAIRRAVGDEQLTYLGFSYGSLLGAVYAHLFPENIRAMVLDGAVDPQQGGVASAEEQARGFERALDNFSAWCADRPDECPLEPDARTAITDALESARRDPATGADGRRATAGWVFYALVSALYAQQTWPVLAAAIDQLAGGDPGGVFDLADSYARRGEDGTYANLFEANTAITCADEELSLSVARVRDLQEQWREEYPLFGAPLAVGLLSCQQWPAEPDPYPVGAAEGAPPIVVIGTTGDPATPYESTARLAELLEVGRVLTYEGEGHTAYPGTSCVNDAVDGYLVDLTVPDEGATCPAE